MMGEILFVAGALLVAGGAAVLLLRWRSGGLRRRRPPVNTNRDGVAIDGYDPVAYFVEGRARRGSSEFPMSWGGATWHFAEAENRDAFAADPARYVPAYGGYCAWAASRRKIAPVDPRAWHIENGRLFLNYNGRLNRRFTEASSELIAAGDASWPELRRRYLSPADSADGAQ
jgi:YHS domain-containing protein